MSSSEFVIPPPNPSSEEVSDTILGGVTPIDFLPPPPEKRPFSKNVFILVVAWSLLLLKTVSEKINSES